MAACLVFSAASLAQEDPSVAPLPYLQASPEDGFVARTLREERVGHRQFAAVFDDGSAGCSVSAEPFYASDMFLFGHGVVFDFTDFGVMRPISTTPTPGESGWLTLSFGPPHGAGSVDTHIAPGGTGYGGTASAVDCTIQIGWQKFARREGRWIEAAPVAARDIRDFDEREKHFRRLTPDGTAGMMTFLFDTAAEDGCPEGSGTVVSRPHSLLSELGGRFTGRVEREDVTRFSNDFTIQSVKAHDGLRGDGLAPGWCWRCRPGRGLRSRLSLVWLIRRGVFFLLSVVPWHRPS